MKQVKTDKYEIGKRYMVYRKDVGKFKKVFIFEYDGIFTSIPYSYDIDYKKGCYVRVDNRTAFEGSDLVAYELDSEESFKHFDMEEITRNL